MSGISTRIPTCSLLVVFLKRTRYHLLKIRRAVHNSKLGKYCLLSSSTVGKLVGAIRIRQSVPCMSQATAAMTTADAKEVRLLQL